MSSASPDEKAMVQALQYATIKNFIDDATKLTTLATKIDIPERSSTDIKNKLNTFLDKTVIKTVTPGKPFFQTSSAGYDNYRGLKTVKDSKLKSYNTKNRMEVKIGISFFEDVIEKAGLKDSNFATQKKFLLDNQDKLLALAYRVPTQG